MKAETDGGIIRCHTPLFLFDFVTCTQTIRDIVRLWGVRWGRSKHESMHAYKQSAQAGSLHHNLIVCNLPPPKKKVKENMQRFLREPH